MMPTLSFFMSDLESEPGDSSGGVWGVRCFSFRPTVTQALPKHHVIFPASRVYVMAHPRRDCIPAQLRLTPTEGVKFYLVTV